MGELIKALGDLTANPNGLLVLAGLLLLLLGAWGKIEGRINLDFPSRVASGVLGVFLTTIGILLQINSPPPGIDVPRGDHELLQRAYNLAAERNFTEAIKVAGQISTSSPLSVRAREKIDQWRSSINLQQQGSSHTTLQMAYDAASKSDFKTAIDLARRIPKSSVLSEKAGQKIREWGESAQQTLRDQDHTTFTAAYDLANRGEFLQAISILEKYRRGATTSDDRQRADLKIGEWRLAYRSAVKSVHQEILQAAFQYAESRDFQAAIAKAETIPRDSVIWPAASRKIRQWSKSLEQEQKSVR